MDETKKCPYCGEEILAVAKKCKHCGEWLVPGGDGAAAPVKALETEVPPTDWEAERAKYQAEAEAGNAQACFDLGKVYMDEGLAENDNVACYQKAYPWFRKAAEGGVNDANVAITYLVNFNVDDNISDADVVNYLKRYIDNYDDKHDSPDYLAVAYCFLAEKCADGQGIQKDIPKAYQWAKQSLDMGCDGAKDVMSSIEARYPMNEEGEIDLDAHGRSGWLTFFIILGILGSVWGFVFPQISDEAAQIYGAPFFVGMAVNLAVYVGTLFWQRWAGWTMLAQLILSPFAFYFSMTSLDASGFASLSPLGQLCASQIANPFVSIFILLLLQRRKQGYALPVCSLFGIRDDGRNFATRVKDKLMAYGEGEAYLSDSDDTQRFRYLCMAATAVVAAMGVYVAYCYITSDREWGMDIEWRVWKSPTLWFCLSVIGFFVQFFDWQHFSYETYLEWEDPNTGKKKREKKNDVLDTMEGSFLYPLLMHALVMPAGYGALFYYIIMGVMALIGALIPWVVGALSIGFAALFFLLCRRLYARRWRVALLLAWCLLALFFLAVVCTPAKVGGTHANAVEAVESQFGGYDGEEEADEQPGSPFADEVTHAYDGHYDLEGVIDNKYHFVMDLAVDGNEAEGSYVVLENNDGSVSLHGNVDADGQLVLNEYKSDGTPTGYYFSGVLADGSFNGDYSSTNRNLNMRFHAGPRQEAEAVSEEEAEVFTPDETTVDVAAVEELIRAEEPAENNSEEAKVFDVVEQMPSFPGGSSGLMQYLSSHIKYPVIAEENGLQGRVICTFIVERDGSITNVQVAKSVDPSLDKEAVRVVKGMPKWTPGRQNGSAVRTKYTLPVTFRLQ